MFLFCPELRHSWCFSLIKQPGKHSRSLIKQRKHSSQCQLISIYYDMTNYGLWNVVICLFVCFDVHRPSRKPATPNKTSSLKTFVWFDLSLRPHGNYPEDRGPFDRRDPCSQGIADINRRVFYITGFTNVLRFRLLDWKLLLKMDAPCVHVSQQINIHTVYRVLCVAVCCKRKFFLNVFQGGVEMFIDTP